MLRCNGDAVQSSLFSSDWVSNRGNTSAGSSDSNCELDDGIEQCSKCGNGEATSQDDEQIQTPKPKKPTTSTISSASQIINSLFPKNKFCTIIQSSFDNFPTILAINIKILSTDFFLRFLLGTDINSSADF